MADNIGQFETSDNFGATVVHGGLNGIAYSTIDTTGVNVPATAGGKIDSFTITVRNIGTKQLLVSYDGGNSWQTFFRHQSRGVNVKGELAQLLVKSSTGTIDDTKVEFVINTEPV